MRKGFGLDLASLALGVGGAVAMAAIVVKVVSMPAAQGVADEAAMQRLGLLLMLALVCELISASLGVVGLFLKNSHRVMCVTGIVVSTAVLLVVGAFVAKGRGYW